MHAHPTHCPRKVGVQGEEGAVCSHPGEIPTPNDEGVNDFQVRGKELGESPDVLHETVPGTASGLSRWSSRKGKASVCNSLRIFRRRESPIPESRHCARHIGQNGCEKDRLIELLTGDRFSGPPLPASFCVRANSGSSRRLSPEPRRDPALQHLEPDFDIRQSPATSRLAEDLDTYRETERAFQASRNLRKTMLSSQRQIAQEMREFVLNADSACLNSLVICVHARLSAVLFSVFGINGSQLCCWHFACDSRRCPSRQRR